MASTHHFIQGCVHAGRIGVLVQFVVESDYTVRTNEFDQLARDVAIHIAASSPDSIAALLDQPFAKNSLITVRDRLSKTSALLREEVSIERFIRWDTEIPTSIQPGSPKNPAVALRADFGS